MCHRRSMTQSKIRRAIERTARRCHIGMLFSWLLAATCSCTSERDVIPPNTSPDHEITSPAASDAPPADSAASDAGADAGKPTPEPWKVTVPDCYGGTVKAPHWLDKVPFARALCVHASPSAPVKIDFGSSLISVAEVPPGQEEPQVYYSLAQLQVLPLQRRVVFAVCGGNGRPLPHGSRVRVAHKLPAKLAAQIAERIAQLDAYETNYVQFFTLLASPGTQASHRFLRGQMNEIMNAMSVEGGLLRDALIWESEKMLKEKGLPARPPTFTFE